MVRLYITYCMIQIIIHYIQERWFEGYGPMGHFVGLYGALRRTLLQRNLPSMANLYVTKLERSNYKNLAMSLQRLQGTKKKIFFWHISWLTLTGAVLCLMLYHRQGIKHVFYQKQLANIFSATNKYKNTCRSALMSPGRSKLIFS